MCEGIYSVLVFESNVSPYEQSVAEFVGAHNIVSPKILASDEFNGKNIWHFYSNGYPEAVIDFIAGKNLCGYEVIDLMTGERETVFEGCYMKRTFRTEMKKRLSDSSFAEFVSALSEVTHK